MGRTGKDMDRWLGDGGMPIIGLVGGAFTAYGVDGEDLGWVEGTFTPDRPGLQPPRDRPGRHPLPGARWAKFKFDAFFFFIDFSSPQSAPFINKFQEFNIVRFQ